MLTVSDDYKVAIDAESKQFASKVDIYFDGETASPVSFEDDVVISFDTLEELQATGDSPLGLVSSNDFDLVLDNANRYFSPTNSLSPYFGKLLPNTLVMPYIAVLVDIQIDTEVIPGGEGEEDTIITTETPIFEYIKLGKFYTGDWVAPGNAVHASVHCTDGMQKIFNKPMVQVPALENVTLYDLFALLFEAAGLAATDYVIDEKLLLTTIKYGWFVGSTIKQALQNLAAGACCNVFMNRDGKVKVVSNFTTSDSVTTMADTNQVIGSEMPQNYLDIYSAVNITYNMPYITEQSILLSLQSLIIPIDGITMERISFSSGPVVAIEQVVLTNGTGIIIENVTYGAWDCTITLRNTGGSKTIGLEILGRTIGSVTSSVTAKNDVMLAAIGNKEITLAPYLMQDPVSALEYAQLVLALVSDPVAKVTAEVCGNPAIELNDTVTIVNPSHGMAGVETVISRISLNYAGKLSSTLTGAKRAARTIYDWVCVCPGLYEYVNRG